MLQIGPCLDKLKHTAFPCVLMEQRHRKERRAVFLLFDTAFFCSKTPPFSCAAAPPCMLQSGPCLDKLIAVVGGSKAKVKAAPSALRLAVANLNLGIFGSKLESSSGRCRNPTVDARLCVSHIRRLTNMRCICVQSSITSALLGEGTACRLSFHCLSLLFSPPFAAKTGGLPQF